MDLQVTIREIRRETSEIRSFVLEPKPGQTLPPFEAGAHIDVCPVPGTIRQYSLAGDPADRSRYVIAVKREQNGRGGSSAMHSQLFEGDTVGISLPKNNFGLHDNDGRSLILAGGIG
ncbi:MAG: ferredoxin reductase, partial [Alphaproteobacteria bacterium]